ncbi:MAG: rRNA maturation RNase YbeY [Clostridiales bacterium]|jgi:probable rRNA maturation factor|nr:rRNA maturation RNase YbeY [Clostridiales bacterium]
MIIIAEENSKIFAAAAAAAEKLLKLPTDLWVETEWIADGEEMRALNLQTRRTDGVTDVLSYPALKLIPGKRIKASASDRTGEHGEIYLGSIAVCGERVTAQAVEYGHSELRETAFLFTHGLLHLLGYDHIKKEDEEIMTKIQEEILALAGFTRD